MATANIRCRTVELTKEGSMRIELEHGSSDEVLDLRAGLEAGFDAIVRATFSHTLPVIVVTSANDGPLGDDETPRLYRTWITGYLCAKRMDKA